LLPIVSKLGASSLPWCPVPNVRQPQSRVRSTRAKGASHPFSAGGGIQRAVQTVQYSAKAPSIRQTHRRDAALYWCTTSVTTSYWNILTNIRNTFGIQVAINYTVHNWLTLYTLGNQLWVNCPSVRLLAFQFTHRTRFHVWLLSSTDVAQLTARARGDGDASAAPRGPRAGRRPPPAPCPRCPWMGGRGGGGEEVSTRGE
jgi:hypothetical protein